MTSAVLKHLVMPRFSVIELFGLAVSIRLWRAGHWTAAAIAVISIVVIATAVEWHSTRRAA